MQLIPGEILERYLAVLERRAVPASRQAEYKKWLRYFLDFEAKYRPPDTRSEQVRLFIQKLREKKQTPEQQKQAAHAISLYFESQSKKKAAPGVKKNNLTVSRDISARDVSALIPNPMIYTHCVPSRTEKERKSPLDF